MTNPFRVQSDQNPFRDESDENPFRDKPGFFSRVGGALKSAAPGVFKAAVNPLGTLAQFGIRHTPEIATQVPLGLAESGLATAAGVSELVGAGDAAQSVRDYRDEVREFYGEADTRVGQAAHLMGRMAGEAAQFMVPGGAVGRVAKATGKLKSLASPATRLGQVGREAAFGIPIDAAIGASDREESIAGLAAQLFPGETMESIAESPWKRAAFDAAVGTVIAAPLAALPKPRGGVGAVPVEPPREIPEILGGTPEELAQREALQAAQGTQDLIAARRRMAEEARNRELRNAAGAGQVFRDEDAKALERLRGQEAAEIDILQPQRRRETAAEVGRVLQETDAAARQRELGTASRVGQVLQEADAGSRQQTLETARRAGQVLQEEDLKAVRQLETEQAIPAAPEYVNPNYKKFKGTDGIAGEIARVTKRRDDAYKRAGGNAVNDEAYLARLYDEVKARGYSLREIEERVGIQLSSGIDPSAAVRALGPSVAGGAVGAGVGAAADEENRLRGALVGGAAGAGVAALRPRARPPTKRPSSVLQSLAHMEGKVDWGGAQQRAANRTGESRVLRLRQQVENAYAPVERLGEELERVLPVQQNVRHLLTRVKSIPRRVAAFFHEGIPNPRSPDEVIPGTSMEDMFKPLGKDPKRVRDALTYVTSLRAVGRGVSGFGGDKATLGHARTIVDFFGGDPTITRFAQQWEEYVNGLKDYAVRSGLWTEAQARGMLESDALYVPFRRILEPLQKQGRTGLTGGRGLVNITGGVKRFKGSKRSIMDPAEALAEYTASIVRRADRYRVGASLFEAAEAMGDEVPLLTKVDNPGRGAIGKQLQVLQADLAERGIEVSDDALAALDDLYVGNVDPKNPLIWRNLPNGKREYALVNSPQVWDAVAGMTDPIPEALRTFLGVTLAPLKRTFVGTTTGYSLKFSGFTNPARDIPDALGKSLHGMRPDDIAAGFAQAIGGAAGVRRRNSYVKQLERAGLGHVSLFSNPTGASAVRRQIAPTSKLDKVRSALRRTVIGPLVPLEAVGNISDQGTRLAEVRAAIRKKQHLVDSGKWSPEDLRLYAATFGRGATIDFQNKPSNIVFRLMADYIPFFGAAMSGTFRFGQAFRQNPVRMGAYVTSVAGMSTIAWAMKHRSKEARESVDERPEGERAGFFMFPMDDKGHLTIRFPMSQETGVIHTGVTAGLDAWADGNPDAADLFVKGLIRALPPGIAEVTEKGLTGKGSLAPPIPGVQELFENAQNRTQFGDRPVVPERFKNLPPSERRFDTTPETFDLLAKWVRKLPGMKGASPLQVENVVRGVISRGTDVATMVTDPLARGIMGESAPVDIPDPFLRQKANPLSSAVARTPTGSSIHANHYYDIRARVQQAQQGIKQATGSGDYGAYQRVRSEFGDVLTPQYGAVIGMVDERLKSITDIEQLVRAAVKRGVLDPKEASKRLDALRTERNRIYRVGVSNLRRLQSTGGGR